MPPTRGHDLKLDWDRAYSGYCGMPPTRGHDLKRNRRSVLRGGWDAPHTGARLETIIPNHTYFINKDAPHTGARLETMPLLRLPP